MNSKWKLWMSIVVIFFVLTIAMYVIPALSIILSAMIIIAILIVITGSIFYLSIINKDKSNDK